MRFSAVAVSAALLGVAMAFPQSVVYETEIVTITSCAPEKTNCPGKVHPTTEAVAVPTEVVAVPTEAVPVPTEAAPVIVTSAWSAPPVVPTPISYPNGTVPAPPVHPSAPAESHPAPPAESPAPPAESPAPPATSTYAWTPSASAGIPSAPANTSTPSVPTTPPVFDNGAAVKGFSFAAVAIAAAAFVLA